MKKPFLIKPIIVLDFDDTLICTKQRQYQLIKSFFTQYDIPIASFENYITYRITNTASNTDFANQYFNDKATILEYQNYFEKNIESTVFLDKDRLIVDMELLKKISKNNTLILLSLRTIYERGVEQLINLGLKDYFETIYFLKHQSQNPKTKILNELKQKTDNIEFVGDTFSDYTAAIENNIKFIAVNTGLFPLSGNIISVDNINDYLKSKLNDKI